MARRAEPTAQALRTDRVTTAPTMPSSRSWSRSPRRATTRLSWWPPAPLRARSPCWFLRHASAGPSAAA